MTNDNGAGESVKTSAALVATVARCRELLTILGYKIEMGHWSDVEFYLPQITALLATLRPASADGASADGASADGASESGFAAHVANGGG